MEDRFSMSAEKYLAKYSVQAYFEDAVSQLLEHKDDHPKVNITKFLAEYFISVRDGTHTLFREYNYVRATPHNRASFVKTFWRCYKYIGKKGDLLSVKEYHSLVCLLCPDFPLALLQKTASIILLEDAMDSPISFTDFLYAFQTQFYYDEFIGAVWKSYQDLSRVGASPRDPVIVPSTSGDSTVLKEHQRSIPGNGVDASQLYRQVAPLADRSQFSTPPVGVLKEILQSTQRVTFYGFLLALAKNDALNAVIGKLPSHNEVMSSTYDDKVDLFLPPIRNVTSTKPSDSRPSSAGSKNKAAAGVKVTKATPKTNKPRAGAESGSRRTVDPRRKHVSSSSSDDDSDDSDDSDSDD